MICKILWCDAPVGTCKACGGTGKVSPNYPGNSGRSYTAALRKMVDALAAGQYRRADVLFWSHYYDPEMLCELVRR